MSTNSIYTKHLCDAGRMKLSLVFGVILTAVCIIDNANSMCACRGNKVQKQRCWNECHAWQMATLKENELRCIAEDIIFDCKPDKDRLQDLNSQNPGKRI